MVTINIKKSREFRDTKRNIQLILISSLLFFSVIIGYFNGFNRFNDIRRILRDTNDDDYPHEDSGSFQGNIIEDEHLYPPNLFTDKEIAQWAWILHFIGMFYMFLGISIICDDYFVPTLETIVEKLEMSDDTAGATWLAAGGSAPELFTSFIGIFIAKSDVGFGTIVGSAVFNVLFVVGMCAFFTPGNLPLNWWPFARDLAYYIFSLGILSIFFGGTSPGEIEWWESLTLFLFYIIYVVIMGYNQNIKTWFFSKFINTDNKSILLKEYKSKEELVQQDITPKSGNITGYSSFISSNNDKNNKNIAVTVERENDNDMDNDLKSDNNSDFEYEYCDGPDITYPVYGTYFDKFMFIIKYPIMISTYMTLADVTRESQKKYWPWTFIVSLIWLGAFAYFMVWWAVIVGHCWNIPGIYPYIHSYTYIFIYLSAHNPHNPKQCHLYNIHINIQMR